jgi:hypothetical protein
MARTTGPLGSLTAAGTLVPGLTFRRRGGLTIIERTPTHAFRPTQARLANQTIIKCLTAYAHQHGDLLGLGWGALPRDFAPTPYHAFLKWNLREIWAGQPPTNTYPPPVLASPGSISAGATYPTSNHLRFYVNSTISNPRWVDVAWRTQHAPTVAGPRTLAGIWLVTGLPYGIHWHDDFHVPAGTWYYYFSAVRTNYRFYPGIGWATVVIPS